MVTSGKPFSLFVQTLAATTICYQNFGFDHLDACLLAYDIVCGARSVLSPFLLMMEAECFCETLHTLRHYFLEDCNFNTRWFKYDRDYLCVNKSQFVPVIFEQPYIILLSGLVLQAKKSYALTSKPFKLDHGKCLFGSLFCGLGRK
jgi:hypothetical protein